MFALSKFLSIFLSPFVWIFLGIIIILLVKKSKGRKIFLIIWSIFTYLSITSPFVHFVLAKYETSYQALPKDKVYDCAIVLAGASAYDHYSKSLQMNQAAERITEPVILFKKGLVKKLLISGGSANVFPPFEKEAVYVREFWLDLGVPDSAIIIESESRNTVENANFSKNILEKRGKFKNILLITSALHMPRSKCIFDKAGVNVDAYPVDFMVLRARPKQYSLREFLVPRSNVPGIWEAIIHEWVGLLSARFQK